MLVRIQPYLVLLVAFAAVSSPARGQPANDLCESPTIVQIDEIGFESIEFDTTGATTPNPPPENCADSISPTLHHDIWFEVRTLCGGMIEFRLTAAFDAVLTTYSSVGPTMSCPLPNDDIWTCERGATQNHFLSPLGPGERIPVRISSRAEGIQGTGTLVVVEEHFCWLDEHCEGIADPGCATARCEACMGCVFDPINTGSRCGTDVDVCTTGYCASGACEAVESVYGDVNKDAIVDLSDILCVLDGFRGDFDLCQFNDMDVGNCRRDGVIDLRDILAVLDAFEGAATCCANRG